MESIRGWQQYAPWEEKIAIRAMEDLSEALREAAAAAFAVAGAMQHDDRSLTFRLIGLNLCAEIDRVGERCQEAEDQIATRALAARGRLIDRIRAAAKAAPLSRPVAEAVPDELLETITRYGTPAVDAINRGLEEKEREENAREEETYRIGREPSGESCAFGHGLTRDELAHGECAACEDGAGSEELAAAELLADEAEERFACLHGHATTARELCGAGCGACAAEGRPGMKIAAPALPPALPVALAPPAEEPKPKRKRSSGKCRKAGHVRTPEDLIHGGCSACVLASAGLVPPAVEPPAVEAPASEAPAVQPGLPFVGGDL